MSEYANVDLQALEELQLELRKISSVLKDYTDKVHTALHVTSNEWQDGRYGQFAEQFAQHGARIEEISESYLGWANGYLNVIIEKVKSYNNM